MDRALAWKILLDCFKLDSPVPERCDVLTVAGDNSRSLRFRGKAYSPLIDSIEDLLKARGAKCVSIARIISRQKGPLAYGRVYSQEGGFARALLQKRLASLLSSRSPAYSTMEQAVWGRILDSTGARKVVAIQPSRELCSACHERGVWVADLQHGVISPSHPWYGSKFRAAEPAIHLPGAFLCWDGASRRIIEEWASDKGIATMVIGHPWLTRFARPSPDDELVREISESHERQLNDGDGGKPAVLISLSWGEERALNGFLAEGLLRALRGTASSYRWLIRLHPNQLAGFASHEHRRFIRYFDTHLRDVAQWEAPTFAPLPVVLKNVDLHITWASSVCIEASFMGIRSAVLNPDLHPGGRHAGYYTDQHEKGSVDFVRPVEADITEWVERHVGRKGSVALEGLEGYRSLIDFLAT